jgi:hypothetical protein
MPCNTCKQFGGMPLSYLNNSYRESSASAGSDILHSEPGLARPVINLRGGKRKSPRRRSMQRTMKKRTRRGGFIPSVMGPFIENASRLTPAAAVTAYRMIKNYNKTRKSRK